MQVQLNDASEDRRIKEADEKVCARMLLHSARGK
jgi:hypothetical protein